MICITVKTERVYSHDNSGMPKIEVIRQKFEEMFFYKFLKYLPFQGYINSRVTIEKVTKDGKEIDGTEFIKMLKETIDSIEKVEPTLDEKLALEQSRNADLLARLAAIEAKLGSTDTKPQDEDIEALKQAYEVKFGKKPHPNLGIDKLKERLQ